MKTKDLKTAKVNFNLRSETDDDTKEVAINCVLRWNNQKTVITNVERIKPKYWNKETQRAKDVRAFIDRSSFNMRLDAIEGKIKTVYRAFIDEHDGYPQPEQLRELVRNTLAGKKEEIKEIPTLFSHIQQFLDTVESHFNKYTKKHVTPGTKRGYRLVFDVLKEYAADRGKKLDFENINLAFYHDYKSFLTHNKQYSQNSVGKHIKTLKTFLNDARGKNIDVNTDFKHNDFAIINEEVENIYLGDAELKSIADLNLTNNFALDRVRDLFLIGCYTGLRFSDFTTIPAQSIDLKNNLITITTQKTGKEVVIPIHKTILSILNKYKDKTANSLPPTLSNQKMNVHLKDIAKLAKIATLVSKKTTKAGLTVNVKYKKHELVTTHTARRSFATNSYKMGIPVITIMGITGHKSEATFRNYIKLTSKEHATIIQGFWSRQEMKIAE